MRRAQSFQQWQISNPHAEIIIALVRERKNQTEISRITGMSRYGVRLILQRFAPELGVRLPGQFYREQVDARREERRMILEALTIENLETLIAKGWCPKHYAVVADFCRSWGTSLELLFNQGTLKRYTLGKNLAKEVIHQVIRQMAVKINGQITLVRICRQSANTGPTQKTPSWAFNIKALELANCEFVCFLCKTNQGGYEPFIVPRDKLENRMRGRKGMAVFISTMALDPLRKTRKNTAPWGAFHGCPAEWLKEKK